MTTMRERLVAAVRNDLLRQAYPGGPIRDMMIDSEAGTVEMRNGKFAIGPVVDAILAELRTPDEAMIEAVYDAELDIYWSYMLDERPGGPDAVFTTMIDAISGASK